MNAIHQICITLLEFVFSWRLQRHSSVSRASVKIDLVITFCYAREARATVGSLVCHQFLLLLVPHVNLLVPLFCQSTLFYCIKSTVGPCFSKTMQGFSVSILHALIQFIHYYIYFRAKGPLKATASHGSQPKSSEQRSTPKPVQPAGNSLHSRSRSISSKPVESMENPRHQRTRTGSVKRAHSVEQIEARVTRSG